MYQEIEGNLITKALDKEFDVIAHGCNCFCTQKSGIAKDMVKYFSTNIFSLEHEKFKGDINKLGQIEYRKFIVKNKKAFHNIFSPEKNTDLSVVNCYTQYYYGTYKIHVDYDALALCMRKINFEFKSQHIGLPLIGAGLAGGNWNTIKDIIQKELVDCNVTIVKFKP